MTEENFGPVVNPDGTPTDFTVEMLTGHPPTVTVVDYIVEENGKRKLITVFYNNTPADQIREEVSGRYNQHNPDFTVIRYYIYDTNDPELDQGLNVDLLYY